MPVLLQQLLAAVQAVEQEHHQVTLQEHVRGRSKCYCMDAIAACSPPAAWGARYGAWRDCGAKAIYMLIFILA